VRRLILRFYPIPISLKNSLSATELELEQQEVTALVFEFVHGPAKIYVRMQDAVSIIIMRQAEQLSAS
jgi:hypothetical protein